MVVQLKKAKIVEHEGGQPELLVESRNITLTTATERVVRYESTTTKVTRNGPQIIASPHTETYELKTDLRTPERLGVMLVGLGGNNGSTLYASLLAHRLGIKWMTKRGLQEPTFHGSLIMASSLLIGQDVSTNKDVYLPIHSVAPFVHPNDLVVGGWDINGANLSEAVRRAQVLEPDLQRQLKEHLEKVTPLPSYYHPDYIAANQADRADNVLDGTKESILKRIREDISKFRSGNALDKVIVMWTANTERFTLVDEQVHVKAGDLLNAIAGDHSEISPSTLFAVAAIQEGCCFINGSPQNTLVPGVLELAAQRNVPVAGDDFKSGQTKLKSVLADFLVASGIKPLSIVSYNHLGNNDGKNLAEAAQFRSKEISKSSVLDDILEGCPLYQRGEGKCREQPDHRIVIEYIPAVGDSKRAMDEYESEIYMGGRSTISIHNICEDSLLAVPLMLDLVLLAELISRVSVRSSDTEFTSLNPALSLLSFMLKAPLVPKGTPTINAFMRQRRAIESFLRALNGLPALDELNLAGRL